MALSNETVLEKLQQQFPQSILHSEVTYDMLSIEVDHHHWKNIMAFLKNDDSLKIDFLTDLTGIHYPDNKGKELGVVVHLHNLVLNYRMRIKTFLHAEGPSIDSLVAVFAGANWMERETYDFFGIQFTGHPDLKRILNMDEMDYFPMRKEYHLEDETREDKDDRYFGR